jgi:hypothetical protein
LPDGAAFCSGCGRSQIPAARGSPIAVIGVDRAICVVGGLLGVVGTLLPYLTITMRPPPVSSFIAKTLVSLGACG